MAHRTILAAASALALILGPGRGSAETNKVPPGDACSVGSGNPCKGNNGNPGEQGNAGREIVKIDKKPDRFGIDLPAVSGRSVHISQIGDANVASVTQAARNAYAKLDQTGTDNQAEVVQRGAGTAYLLADQTGNSNFARVGQGGVGGNMLTFRQAGTGNRLTAEQTASGAIHNGAILTQTGNDNRMALTQDGGDNRSMLTQDGTANAMTATQNGFGNQLSWTQQGSNLSDLKVTQSGGEAVQITQTNGGR